MPIKPTKRGCSKDDAEAYTIDIPFEYFTGSPSRIERLERVSRYLEELDFSLERRRLREGGGPVPAWSHEKAAFVERLYKRWLFLRRKYEGEDLPPPEDVAEFWRAHLLDTRRYFRETAAVFGYYLHHYPYSGECDEDDRRKTLKLRERSRKLYEAEFGEKLVDYCESADNGGPGE